MQISDILEINEHDNTKMKCLVYYEPVHECSICHSKFSNTTTKKALIHTDNHKLVLYCFHVCLTCQKAFIAKYSINANEAVEIRDPKVEYKAEFKTCSEIYPSGIQSKTFEDEIGKISPSFIKIYNEAYNAEQYKLFEICGMGYRKSLEFLVKDYLIFKNPELAEKIKGTDLGSCINKDEFGFDDRVKDVAKRCAWLGNDHSHYITKHTDRDLNDLKNLLTITITWITLLLQSEDALQIKKK